LLQDKIDLKILLIKVYCSLLADFTQNTKYQRQGKDKPPGSPRIAVFWVRFSYYTLGYLMK